MTASSTWYSALRRALDQAADEPDPVKRAERAAQIQRDLAHGSEEAAAIHRRAIERLKESGMSYGQISAALAIARGTVQGHAEHSRRVGLEPGLIFAFRDEAGEWHPDDPEAILPGGPCAAGDSITIRGDRPSRFAGQELLCAYEDTPSGRITDDSPGYAYHLTKYGRARRSTRAVHDAIWETA
jgi:DNA-binding CsgD family transcriptional regulator